MSAKEQVPVLICGGGPVGLAVALDLGWRGVPCMLVEQGDGLRVQPKMLTVSVRTMEFCRRWGIDHLVHDWGFPVDFPFDNVFVTSLAGFEIARLPKPPLGELKSIAVSPDAEQHCPQTWFDPILREAAQSYDCVTLRHRVRLESFRTAPDVIEATLVDLTTGAEETVRADYLVGCDGYRSTVREGLGISMQGRDPVDKSVNLLIRIPHLEAYHDKGNAGRYVIVREFGTWATCVAIDGRELWRITLYGSDHFDPYDANYEECIERCLGRRLDFELVNVERWTRRGMVAERYGAGRVWLAGDAVHAMPPNGGFGMNTGIADATDLAWMLAAMHHGWGGPNLLDAYESERRPVGIRTVNEALRDYDRLTSNTSFPGITDDTQDGAAIRRQLGARLEDANRRAWEPIGIHLGNRYDTSPIVISDNSEPPDDDEMIYEPTARPGSRAPHVALSDERSTLDLLGRNFTLLHLDRNAPDPLPLVRAARASRMPLDVVELRDPSVADAYERPLVLVRPDGHVAWRGANFIPDAKAIIDIVRGATRERVPS